MLYLMEGVGAVGERVNFVGSLSRERKLHFPDERGEWNQPYVAQDLYYLRVKELSPYNNTSFFQEISFCVKKSWGVEVNLPLQDYDDSMVMIHAIGFDHIYCDVKNHPHS
jgi:hypothetical protein